MDLIERIVIHKLGNGFDRRGKLVTFFLKEIPNTEYMFCESALFIRNVINLLSDSFRLNWNEENTIKDYLFGEAQDCWLNKDYAPVPIIWINHKYWSDKQIEAFVNIIKNIANLYDWEIEKEP